MATPATALMVSTEGVEVRAAAAAVQAVRHARRASSNAYNTATATRSQPVDFTSLRLAEWNRQGAQNLFKLVDGQLVFTGGGDIARRATADAADGTEGVIVHMMRAGDAASEAVEATVEGVPAALVPLAGVPPHEAVGLALAGHQPQRLQLDAALSLLGLAWAAVDGAEAETTQSAVVGTGRASGLDEVWLLGAAGAGHMEAAGIAVRAGRACRSRRTTDGGAHGRLPGGRRRRGGRCWPRG
eukprot:6199414-Pleurochrysis_carterae.AAC.1